MLIMTYANARANGDGSLISTYVSRGSCLSPYKSYRIGQYGMLTSWADYLVNTLLFIHDQYVVFINVLPTLTLVNGIGHLQMVCQSVIKPISPSRA